MTPRRSRAALTASPVLVGAVTVLVTIVAVFLSYNANTGLPFVPTYDLKANLPNASQLVEGFDVRIGGVTYQVIARLRYADPLQKQLLSVLGFMVNLGWIRHHYFTSIATQVARIAGADAGLTFTMVTKRSSSGIWCSASTPERPRSGIS